MGEYGIQPQVPLAYISIRNMAESYPECQRRLCRHEVLNSWPGLDDKVEGVLCS